MLRLAALRTLTPVDGRMELFGGQDAPLAVVDYAHTPDALAQTLAALRRWPQARQGRLWCVFGCGGDRDATKRPLMGGVAERLADDIILTSDNPRSEIRATSSRPSPTACRTVPRPAGRGSRRRHPLCHQARGPRPTWCCVAGKGHEATQEIQGKKRPFSDREHDAPDAGRPGGVGTNQTTMTNLQQAAGWMAGARVVGDASRTFTRVHTDSRTVELGDLLVALQGERFDAHDFLADVVARGAAAVLVSRETGLDVPAIVVPDTRIGLGELGAGWRRQFHCPRWP